MRGLFVRALCFLLLFSVLTVGADAAEYTLTKGTADNIPFGMMVESGCEYKLYGEIPGMSLVQFRGAMILDGTPTAAGEYSVTLTATRDGQEIGSETVTVTVQDLSAPPAEDGSGTPQITKHPTGETVVEGGSAVFIARAENVRQYVWEILTTDGGTISCSGMSGVLDDVTVSGDYTEKVVLGNIPMALDGCKIRCRFVGAEESVYSDYAIITVIAKEDTKPVVTKNPTAETVEEGGMAQFVARADYATDYVWSLVSPNGSMSYPLTTVPAEFAGLKISGNHTECLTLSNIPLALDGWEAVCMFQGYSEDVSSKGAKLTVVPKPTESPETEPTETAPPEKIPEETAVPTVEATQPPTAPATHPAVESTTAPIIQAPEPTEIPRETKGNPILLPVIILCGSAVAIAAIAAYVVLKLRAPGREEDEEYLEEEE